MGFDLRHPYCASNVGGKALRKNLSRFMPCNPLISLDSDERIQGNPRESNTSERGVRRETAARQENPNGSTGPTSGPRPIRPAASSGKPLGPGRGHIEASKPHIERARSAMRAPSLLEAKHDRAK